LPGQNGENHAKSNSVQLTTKFEPDISRTQAHSVTITRTRSVITLGAYCVIITLRSLSIGYHVPDHHHPPWTWQNMKIKQRLLTTRTHSVIIYRFEGTCHHTPRYKIQMETSLTTNTAPRCIRLPRRSPYFDVVVGLVWSHDPESYDGGSVCYR
jgi:hypothetical protein